jgi:hypothetical protein
VAEACDEAREALGRAHRHRVNLRGWPTTAAEAAMRAARASSVLDGGSLTIGAGTGTEGDVADPVLAGALRVAEALEGGATALVGVWQRAPMQAIARLHALAAADLTDDDRLGRPRSHGFQLRCWPPSRTVSCSRSHRSGLPTGWWRAPSRG